MKFCGLSRDGSLKPIGWRSSNLGLVHYLLYPEPCCWSPLYPSLLSHFPPLLRQMLLTFSFPHPLIAGDVYQRYALFLFPYPPPPLMKRSKACCGSQFVGSQPTILKGCQLLAYKLSRGQTNWWYWDLLILKIRKSKMTSLSSKRQLNVHYASVF